MKINFNEYYNLKKSLIFLENNELIIEKILSLNNKNIIKLIIENKERDRRKILELLSKYKNHYFKRLDRIELANINALIDLVKNSTIIHMDDESITSYLSTLPIKKGIPTGVPINFLNRTQKIRPAALNQTQKVKIEPPPRTTTQKIESKPFHKTTARFDLTNI